MTFEEFKQDFERFAKVDTPEKMAICQREYERYLHKMEDANYFEPIEEKDFFEENSYRANLWRLFNTNQIAENQVYFFVIPSFEPEYQLLFEQQENGLVLHYTILSNSYWSVYSGYKQHTIEKTTKSALLNADLSGQISHLLQQAFATARKPSGRSIILDGTQYNLLKLDNGKVSIVKQHSPHENSHTAWVISMLKNMRILTEV